MNEKIFVIPEPGRRVVDPVTRQPLPAEGAEVSSSSHWHRRVREGDVRLGRAPKATTRTQEK